jgi:surfeit locus 1 family protein
LGRLAPALLAVALAAVAVRLGVWQLDRLADRRATNRVELAAREMPVLDIDRVIPATTPLAGRRVTARGVFLADGELLLRNRVHREAPGVHVVTPLRTAGTGALIWILRGFAHAANGVTPDNVPPPPAGTVTVRGVMAALPVTDNRGRPAVTGGDTTWQRLDSAMVAQRLPGSLAVVLYLAGDAGGPGQLPAIEPPTLGEGPHLSYAIQWFGIALAILAFAALVLRKSSGRGPAPPPAAP